MARRCVRSENTNRSSRFSWGMLIQSVALSAQHRTIRVTKIIPKTDSSQQRSFGRTWSVSDLWNLLKRNQILVVTLSRDRSGNPKRPGRLRIENLISETYHIYKNIFI